MVKIYAGEKNEGNEKHTSKSMIGLILDIVLCRGDLESTGKREVEPISIKELFRFATTRDKCFLTIGAICALLSGAIQPFVLILGGWITSLYLRPEEKMGNDKFSDEVTSYIIWLGAAGVAALITSFLQKEELHCTRLRPGDVGGRKEGASPKLYRENPTKYK
ncbi:unnamed protein product [Strongylus vulgaris]|uniref:ABC transmembrane type-1 domain-containing protein n=1 Tax=Strongylus vulgaris TaxID=40348 RepID=A0A3P7JL42_STRVU|nr:unnamed protein product [Strongylus vulgaris]